MRGTKTERSPGVWRLRVYMGDDPKSGNLRQATRTFKGTKKEADTALAAFVSGVDPLDLGAVSEDRRWLSGRTDLIRTTARGTQTQWSCWEERCGLLQPLGCRFLPGPRSTVRVPPMGRKGRRVWHHLGRCGTAVHERAGWGTAGVALSASPLPAGGWPRSGCVVQIERSVGDPLHIDDRIGTVERGLDRCALPWRNLIFQTGGTM